MAELLADQIVDGNLILNFMDNTKKIGVKKLSASVFKARLDLLKGYWSAFDSRHKLIYRERKALEKEDYFVKNYYIIVQQSYIETMAQINDDLERERPSGSSRTIEGDAAAVQPAVLQSSLPKLSLPKFSGSQLEWENFREMFSSMVMDVTTLSPVVKLQHLMTCLEGDAAKRLKNVKIIGSNLEVAWDTLVRRYDNRRVRLSAQMNNLIASPSASRKSVSEITRLLDTTEEGIRALRSLGRPVDQWDDWFVHLIVFKLDSSTREDWEKSLEDAIDFPTYKQLVSFLENRIRALDAANSNDPVQGHKWGSSQQRISKTRKVAHVNHANVALSKTKKFPPCPVCQGEHFIGYCPRFAQSSYGQRVEHVVRCKLCHNCLRGNHSTPECPSSSSCLVCGKKHHTKLHRDHVTKSVETPGVPSGSRDSTSQASGAVNSSVSGYTASTGKTVLLATALVLLESPNGNTVTVRALLDPAAEESFVTAHVAQMLSLPSRSTEVAIHGVGDSVSAVSRRKIDIVLRSPIDQNFSMSFSALVLNKLTNRLPHREVVQREWPHIKNLTLADPHFGKPARVDCILSAEVYALLILDGLRKGSPGSPIAQRTVLGWILTGRVLSALDSSPRNSVSGFHAVVNSSISEDLRRFWEIEEGMTVPRLSIEDERCEELFKQTVERDTTGRFKVSLPFSRSPAFSDTRSIAVSCFLRNERKFTKNPALAQEYVKFMDEYLKLAHMELIPSNEVHDRAAYYLPHHAVFKKGENNKIRVVFNASQRSSNGLSLNDCLFTGTKLQSDLPSILTRWRLPRYVFTADIVKMFRQIRIRPEDADWQRIVWRSSVDRPLQDFRLTTVTYGTAAAPFLAIRVLHQLAEEEGQRFPRGAAVLRTNTYVDDAFTGDDELSSTIELRDELIAILASAGFTLSKWAANHPDLLRGLTSAVANEHILEPDELVSTLGLRWLQNQDLFCFRVSLPDSPGPVTKRTILSETARLFDPLGWFAPVIIRAKLLLQALWIVRADWDEPLSGELHDAWINLRESLPQLQEVRIPRWLNTNPGGRWELHAFSDASERAYAAAFYSVSRTSDGEITSLLLAAKSKVAPINSISISKLELCGAHLLA